MSSRYFEIDVAGNTLFAVKINEKWFDDFDDEDEAVFAYCHEIAEELNDADIYIPRHGDGCLIEEIELDLYRDFDDKF